MTIYCSSSFVFNILDVEQLFNIVEVQQTLADGINYLLNSRQNGVGWGPRQNAEVIMTFRLVNPRRFSVSNTDLVDFSYVRGVNDMVVELLLESQKWVLFSKDFDSYSKSRYTERVFSTSSITLLCFLFAIIYQQMSFCKFNSFYHSRKIHFILIADLALRLTLNGVMVNWHNTLPPSYPFVWTPTTSTVQILSQCFRGIWKHPKVTSQVTNLPYPGWCLDCVLQMQEITASLWKSWVATPGLMRTE